MISVAGLMERSGATREQVVDAALRVAGDLRPVRYFELSTAAGVDRYELPDNFAEAIGLQYAERDDARWKDDLLEWSRPLLFDWRIAGGEIVIDPVPTSVEAFRLSYVAVYVPQTVDGVEMLDIGAAVEPLVGKYAAYLAAVASMLTASGQAMRFRIGDEEVDRSRAGSEWRGAVGVLREEYESAVEWFSGDA